MDELPDSGLIGGLPEGWVCAKAAVVRYCALLIDKASGEDLAPSLPVGISESAQVVRRDAWIVAAFQSALLSGKLSASLFDGHGFKALPKMAFLYPGVLDAGLRNGAIELDPLWPDEWRPWNGEPWTFRKDQLDAWLSSAEAFSVEDLPPEPSTVEGDEIAPLRSREPSQRNRVALSEAVSWIAFGLALDADRLKDAIRWDRLAGGELPDAQRKVAIAIESLLNAGADEKIAFHGRHAADKHANGGTTVKIEPHQLDDYRQFLIGFDKLHGGKGLKRWHSDHNHYRNYASDRPDLFTHVTVNRDDLMRCFPPETDNMKAFLVPLPAALPDIGPVMRLDEALSWTAHGRPSFDTLIWKRPDGSLRFSDPDGVEIQTSDIGEKPPHIVAYLDASRDVCAALRDGSLIGYIAPINGQPLSVPRLYWNGVAPDYLDHVYRGMLPGERGAGCPILLSRMQFDGWRASQSAIALPAATQRPTAKSSDASAGVAKHVQTIPYNDQERLAWMAAQPLMAADKAFDIYRADPRRCRMKRPEFRGEWKRVKGTKQGRQPKSQIAN